MLTPCSSLCNPVKSTMSQLQSYMSVANYTKVHCLHWLQRLEDVLQNMCSQKLLIIQRKIIVLEVERVVAWKLTTLSKRDYNKGVFQWVLRNFWRTAYFIEQPGLMNYRLVWFRLEKGVCIYRSPALFLAPDPGPGPQFAFTGPGTQFVFTYTGLQFHYQSGAWVWIY